MTPDVWEAGSVLRLQWRDSEVVVRADPPISVFPRQDHKELGTDDVFRDQRLSAAGRFADP